MPHAGDWERAGVLAESGAFLLPLRVGQAGRSTGGTLPRALSFFEVQPGILQLSAVKQAEDGKRLVIRLWNPTGQPIEASLQCFRPLRAAHSLTLAEEPGAKLRVRKGCVRFLAGAKQIVTLGLRV
jgi:alpha-mannosidase